MTSTLWTKEKIQWLSTQLQQQIRFGDPQVTPDMWPVTSYLVHTKIHCNGGAAVRSWLYLKKHLNNNGKLFLTMSWAGSSFQMGKMISELIRAGKLHGISVTGANMEESLYRYVAHSQYAYIYKYNKLTSEQEEELRQVGIRRITDTFLPEEESVRVVLDPLMALWRKAEKEGKSYLWHEYFFQLFEHNLIQKDPEAREEDCWLYNAWKYNIPVYVPGWEDSTMGNIFTHACYNGDHPFLSQYKLESPISMHVVKHNFEYMHHISEYYMTQATTTSRIAFLQLGGGIAADFPICVVPHIKHDYLAEETDTNKDTMVLPWDCFIEINSGDMSYGSYTAAWYDEKITWDKFAPWSFGQQIHGDYTLVFPDIAAIILNK
jgi:deoxyhypusine synthase